LRGRFVLKPASFAETCTRENLFTPAELDLLSQAAGQIALSVENALAYRQIEELQNELAETEAQVRHETSLKARIERNMATVDRALDETYRLNPQGKRRADLPDDVRELVTRATRSRKLSKPRCSLGRRPSIACRPCGWTRRNWRGCDG
jgi:GAF domain-containing protein